MSHKLSDIHNIILAEKGACTCYWYGGLRAEVYKGLETTAMFFFLKEGATLHQELVSDQVYFKGLSQ